MSVALCKMNAMVIGGFPTQRASNLENISMSWHLHDKLAITYIAVLILQV